MTRVRQYASRLILAWVCSFAYLLVIYSPTIFISVAHHDQYRYFSVFGEQTSEMKSHRHADPQWNWQRLIGRPIAAELEYQIFKRANTLDDLIWARLVGMGLYAVAMAMFVCCLLELKLSATLAFCVAGAIFALPAVQYTLYMTSWNHPVAYILALASAFAARLGSRLSVGKRWYEGWWRLASNVLAIALLVFAELSYAHCAFVMLFPIAAEIALKGIAGWLATRRHLVRDTCLLAGGCVVYFAIVRWGYVAQGPHSIPEYQVEIHWDPIARVQDFLGDLPWLLNLWNVHFRPWIGQGVLGFSVSGLLVLLVRQLARAAGAKRSNQPAGQFALRAKGSESFVPQRERFSRSWQLMAAIGLVLLVSETPYFATPRACSLYRTHFAFEGIVVLLLAGAARCWGSLIGNASRPKMASGLAWSTLVVVGLVANHNVLMNALDDSLELSYICAQISAHADEPIRRIHVVQPDLKKFCYTGQAIVERSDEFNVPTAAQAGSVSFEVQAALQTLFERESIRVSCALHTPEGIAAAGPDELVLTFSPPGEPVVPSPDTLIIDMNDLLRIAMPTKRPWRPAAPLETATVRKHGISRR